jgi:fermentation-respiration switch protein FrsA (DUF1100 family)
MRKLATALAIAVGIYLTGVAVLFAFQRDLIYAPDRVGHVPPVYYAMLAGVDEIALETAAGFDLKAWYSPAPAGRPTVVLFLGKSGSLRSQRYRLRYFQEAQMGALLLAYRGYSGNEGEPSEQGLYSDARAALDWLQLRGIPDTSIVLYGASLGSGVATEMAAEGEYGAVVLEAPYTSIVDVAAHRFPIVPVRWLLRDRFDSLSRIDALTEPLLVMHGDRDRVVPQNLGRWLFDAADAPKQGFWPAGVGHNDLFDRGGFAVAVGFIERSVSPSG